MNIYIRVCERERSTEALPLNAGKWVIEGHLV